MARSINDIYSSMLATHQADPILSINATSTSASAIYKLFYFIVAVAINLLEQLYDEHKIEVEDRAMQMIPGTARWLAEHALSFQYGDDLIWSNNQFIYQTIDDSKMIIKRVAISESAGKVIIKASKFNAVPVPLTAQELISFSAYMNKIKFAGTYLSISSYDADLVNIYINILFNPLIMNPNGTLILDSSSPITQSLNDYFANLQYGGALNRTKIIDAAQSSIGVIDAYFFGDGVTVKSVNQANFIICGQNHQALSGYFTINQLNINFIANVV